MEIGAARAVVKVKLISIITDQHNEPCWTVGIQKVLQGEEDT